MLWRITMDDDQNSDYAFLKEILFPIFLLFRFNIVFSYQEIKRKKSKNEWI